MNKQFLLIIYFLAIISPCISQTQKDTPIIASKIVRSPEGKGYLEVDGKPWFFSNVQAMGSSHIYDPSWGSDAPIPLDWLENMFEKTNAAGYRTIAVMLYWRDIEPETRGNYNWQVINKYVDWCNKYDMRLEIIWYGTNTCGGARLQGYLNSWYPQIPQYLQDHDKYWNNGPLFWGKNDVHQPFLPSKNEDAANLYQWERDAVHNLFNHLAQYDVNKRTIAIQLVNEPNAYINYFTDEYRQVIDQLGAAVKTSQYVVATCVNYTHHTADPKVNALPNVDFVGIDPYTDNPDLLQQDIVFMDSNMPYISENDGKVANMSKLMITVLVNGGSYNTWHLNNHWSDQGIYDPAAQDFKKWTLGQIPALRANAQATKRLLTGINKIGSIVATAPPARMIGFNLYGLAKYNETIAKAGYAIGFATDTTAAGMAIVDNNAIYFVSDGADEVQFSVNVKPLSVSAGYIDNDGKWIENSQKEYSFTNGKYTVAVKAEECVKINHK